MTEQRIKKLRNKLQQARYSIANRYDGKYASFAAPLYFINYVAVEDIYRISTNGDCIFFNPDWLQKLGNIELEFILAHQLMHIAKGHIDRPQIYKGDRFHLGCDIIANANLIDMGYKFNKLSGIGNIYYETFFPNRYYGTEITPEEAFAQIPFDPANLPLAKRRQYMIDSDEYWDKNNDTNYGITILSPNDKEAEGLELSDVIWQEITAHQSRRFANSNIKNNSTAKKLIDQEGLLDLKNWVKCMGEPLENLRSKTGSRVNRNFWQTLRKPQLNWKEILNQFLQENVFDYSFVPPDRRFNDFDLFLPNYNDCEFLTKDIVFMIDTSASINKKSLINIYSELCSATEQFNGKFRGLLGFFDTDVKHDLISFSSVDDLHSLIPIGGGGTDFCSVFNYINNKCNPDNIASVIIFTDGKGFFPNISPLANIPILWMISNDTIDPPFGTIARIK